MYNEEHWNGRVDGKIAEIHQSSRDPLLNTRIPKLGINIRIPNPLPKLVGSTQKGHSKVAKAVDSYDIRANNGQLHEGIKPEGRKGSEAEAWNLVSRDERLESAGPTMMDKAGKVVQSGQAFVAGREQGYEELGGGGMIAVATTYGSQLMPALTDLTEILKGRIEAQSTRHSDAVASNAGTAGTIASAIVAASKAIEKVGDALEKLDLTVEVTPVVGQIYQAIKLAAKIVKMIAKIYITYKSLQNEGTRLLLSFSEQVAASGAIEAITALSADIAKDENLTEAARSTVTKVLAKAVANIKEGVQKYDQLEQQVRSAVSVST